MKYFQHNTIKILLDKYKSIWALSHAKTLMGWDLETFMPDAGSVPRGQAAAKLSALTQKLYTDESFVKAVSLAKEAKAELNDYELGVLRIIDKNLQKFQKLPAEFVEQFDQVTNEAQVAWRKAREEDDFQQFVPYLEKIVSLTKQKAEYLGYEDHPYDALIDNYEAGMTKTDVDQFFSEIRPFLTDLLAKINNSGEFTSPSNLDNEEYNLEVMQKINEKILEFVQMDRSSMRLDLSTHPFTESLASSNDVRITTRFGKQGFAEPITSTLHEYGHGLYEQQTPLEFEYTPLQGGNSLGIHESQSRFWENSVGRNMSFIQRFLGEFQQLSPVINEATAKDIYHYFNRVEPGFIRVEADEVTYHFHIMIRYELELALLEGELKVAELEEAWNKKYTEYLGITPSSAAQGVLQDIHWSMGAIGYFPTYSTGTVLSATWKDLLEAEHGTINDLIADANAGIGKIKAWLKDNVHKFGSTYTFNDLVEKQTGKEFTTLPWQSYLEHKYL